MSGEGEGEDEGEGEGEGEDWNGELSPKSGTSVGGVTATAQRYALDSSGIETSTPSFSPRDCSRTKRMYSFASSRVACAEPLPMWKSRPEASVHSSSSMPRQCQIKLRPPASASLGQQADMCMCMCMCKRMCMGLAVGFWLAHSALFSTQAVARKLLGQSALLLLEGVLLLSALALLCSVAVVRRAGLIKSAVGIIVVVVLLLRVGGSGGVWLMARRRRTWGITHGAPLEGELGRLLVHISARIACPLLGHLPRARRGSRRKT